MIELLRDMDAAYFGHQHRSAISILLALATGFTPLAFARIFLARRWAHEAREQDEWLAMVTGKAA